MVPATGLESSSPIHDFSRHRISPDKYGLFFTSSIVASCNLLPPHATFLSGNVRKTRQPLRLSPHQPHRSAPFDQGAVLGKHRLGDVRDNRPRILLAVLGPGH